MVTFEHLHSVPLAYNGECGLLGVGPDLDLWTEELYGEDSWLAQHHFAFTGELLSQTDEQYGENTAAEPLEQPHNLARPRTGMNSTRLTFGGARHRGMLAEDRVEDMVRPLDMQDKILLVETGLLPSMPPPSILGLAQSYVASEVKLVGPGAGSEPLYLLSRKIRIAFRLLELATDETGQPYDYDSQEISLLQYYFPLDEDKLLGETMLTASELGFNLNWPTDIVLRDAHLFVADSARGNDSLTSRIHVWYVNLP